MWERRPRDLRQFSSLHTHRAQVKRSGIRGGGGFDYPGFRKAASGLLATLDRAKINRACDWL